MTSLEPYPEYKDSGVPWLGDVPAEWKVKPIKFVATYNDEVLGESTSPDTELTYVEISDVSEDEGVRLNAPIRFGEAPSRARRVAHKGDVLVSTVRTYLRAIAAIDEEPPNLIASTGFAVLRATNVEANFLRYAMLTEYVIDEIISRSVGVSYPAINASDLVRIKLPVPSPAEQGSITQFLDRESAEIAKFIADQEELIALLNERRAATITQAVTFGLNSDIQRKASGISWLGEVPKHWVPQRLSRLGITQESGTSVNGHSDPADSDSIGVLKTSAASKGFFDPEGNKKVVDHDVDRVTCQVRSGWLLVNRANTPDLVGSAAYVSGSYPNLYLSDKLWQIDFVRADNRFMYWWLNSTTYKSQLQFHRVGASASMQNLSFADFKSLDIAVPPSYEQEEIAAYLDRETSRIDSAINDAKEAIGLSKERRTALISAAVTGKIDVRNHKMAELGAA